MSKPWKGWAQPKLADGGDYGALVVRGGPERAHTHPVLVTPIDDESLPHPGDGRNWETAAGIPVTVIGVDDGHVWLRLANGARSTLPVGCLRERKPEPEHEAWCHKTRLGSWSGTSAPYVACSCERRSGEERRQGERRNTTGVTWRFVGGRRSGTDRRQS